MASQDLDLQRYREYLGLLARSQLGHHFRGKIDASDIVQQALLEAHKGQDQFRGSNEFEYSAWLRRILANVLAKAIRNLGVAKRDVNRERSLHEELERSSARLDAFLIADVSSPSRRLDREEMTLHAVDALSRLPERQREAVVLRYCQGWSVSDIARHLDCSAPNVIGLLKRATEAMRDVLERV